MPVSLGGLHRTLSSSECAGSEASNVLYREGLVGGLEAIKDSTRSRIRIRLAISRVFGIQ